MNLQALYEKRAKVHADITSMLDENEQDGLNTEQRSEFDKLDAEYDRLTDEIRIGEKINERDAEEKRLVESRSLETAKTGDTAKFDFRSDFRDFFRNKRDTVAFELRATTDPQSVGTDADGGYTVPEEWVNGYYGLVEEGNIMRMLASRQVMSKGDTIRWPKVSARGTAALTAEEGATTVAKDDWAEVTFNAYKLDRIIKVTEELLNDSLFDMAAFIQGSLAQSIAILEENYFLTGTGSSQPNGLFTACSTGVTAASATAITADEIIDLYHSVSHQYRSRNSVAWIMADSTVKIIRKLKDGDSQYLWQPGMQAGQPDRLLGRPLYTSDKCPAATTALDSIAFGDISAYMIMDRTGINVQRLNELYIGNGIIGYRAYVRTDGDLVDTNAVKVLTMA